MKFGRCQGQKTNWTATTKTTAKAKYWKLKHSATTVSLQTFAFFRALEHFDNQSARIVVTYLSVFTIWAWVVLFVLLRCRIRIRIWIQSGGRRSQFFLIPIRWHRGSQTLGVARCHRWRPWRCHWRCCLRATRTPQPRNRWKVWIRFQRLVWSISPQFNVWLSSWTLQMQWPTRWTTLSMVTTTLGSRAPLSLRLKSTMQSVALLKSQMRTTWFLDRIIEPSVSQ